MCWSADEKTKQFAEELGENLNILARAWCTGISQGVTLRMSGVKLIFKITEAQVGTLGTMPGRLSLERQQSLDEVRAGWRGAPPQHVLLEQIGLHDRDKFQRRVLDFLRGVA